jgi:hypothetical protein
MLQCIPVLEWIAIISSSVINQFVTVVVKRSFFAVRPEFLNGYMALAFQRVIFMVFNSKFPFPRTVWKSQSFFRCSTKCPITANDEGCDNVLVVEDYDTSSWAQREMNMECHGKEQGKNRSNWRARYLAATCRGDTIIYYIRGLFIKFWVDQNIYAV